MIRAAPGPVSIDRRSHTARSPAAVVNVTLTQHVSTMPSAIRYLQDETSDDTPIDWASILFFGGTVLGVLNWATMSTLREGTAAQYFSELPADKRAKDQVVAMLATVGNMMGVVVMLTMAIFCAGPPSTEVMYSAVCHRLKFLIHPLHIRGWAYQPLPCRRTPSPL